jgi:peptidyl-prolyl cis-trans isomerase B (cyclophilin B)
MPSAQKRRVIEKTRKREKRGRTYLVATILIIIAVGIGWYVYASATAPKPDFMIAGPLGVTIHAGPQTTTSTVSVTAVNQFAGTVLLTAKGSPGLTASISPSSLTGSGTATLTTSAATNGSYAVTITGTSGSLTHFVTPTVATPVFATLSTSNGTIVVELYRAQTPQTVTNFVNLATSGFYTNLVWHRIVKANPAVIQTGDPNTANGGGDRTKWGQGGSSQTVPLEIDGSLHNNAGYLGMARGQALDSGSSQFYINMADNNYLDGQYTVFGRVIGSMSAATAIWNTPTSSQYQPDEPINLVYLNSVTISGGP